MYEPADLAASLADAALVIMPWVGAAVAGGLALLLIFMGIRAGIGFFRGIAGDGEPMSAEDHYAGWLDAIAHLEPKRGDYADGDAWESANDAFWRAADDTYNEKFAR